MEYLSFMLRVTLLVLVSRDDDGASDSGIRTDVNLNHEVYYHLLGTEQSDDVLCWKDHEHPKYIYTPEVTEDGKVH
jgi:prolyl oligopeptidase